MRSQIEDDTTRKVKALAGVTDVVVHTTAMTKQQRADLMSTARFNARENAKPTRVSPLTRVIAIGSGKGGVGKVDREHQPRTGLWPTRDCGSACSTPTSGVSRSPEC